MAAAKAPAEVAKGEYQRRRRALLQMAQDDAILILPAAPERIRSHDTHHPYRQDSDFSYLTGFPEPEAVLVLVPGRAHGETLLFCRERHPERELWDGPRAGPEGAVSAYGIDDAYPIDDIDEILPGLLEFNVGFCFVHGLSASRAESGDFCVFFAAMRTQFHNNNSFCCGLFLPIWFNL